MGMKESRRTRVSRIDQRANQPGISLSLRIRQTQTPHDGNSIARGRVDQRERSSSCLAHGPLPTLSRRFRSPSPVLMNGQGLLNHYTSSSQHHRQKNNRIASRWHYICILPVRVRTAIPRQNRRKEPSYGGSAISSVSSVFLRHPRPPKSPS